MNNYRGPGNTIKLAAGTARSAGDIVVSNEVLGVVAEDATTAQTPVMSIEGVFRLPKATGVTIALGALANYDASADNVTSAATAAAGDVTNFGIAMEAGASADTYINVKLIPGGGTFS